MHACVRRSIKALCNRVLSHFPTSCARINTPVLWRRWRPTPPPLVVHPFQLRISAHIDVGANVPDHLVIFHMYASDYQAHLIIFIFLVLLLLFPCGTQVGSTASAALWPHQPDSIADDQTSATAAAAAPASAAVASDVVAPTCPWRMAGPPNKQHFWSYVGLAPAPSLGSTVVPMAATAATSKSAAKAAVADEIVLRFAKLLASAEVCVPGSRVHFVAQNCSPFATIAAS